MASASDDTARACSSSSMVTSPSLIDCLQALNNTGDALKAVMNDARLALDQAAETTKSAAAAAAAAERYRRYPSVDQLGRDEAVQVGVPAYASRPTHAAQTRQYHIGGSAQPPSRPLLHGRPHAAPSQQQHTLSCPSPTYSKSVGSKASPLYSSTSSSGVSADPFAASNKSVSPPLATPLPPPSPPQSVDVGCASGHSPNYGNGGWLDFTLDPDI